MVELLTKGGARKDLADANSVAAVVEVVQRVVSVMHAASPPVVSVASRSRPLNIRSREDIEHWARRLSSRPPPGPDDDGRDALADLMRLAVERMNALGPTRASRIWPIDRWRRWRLRLHQRWGDGTGGR